VAFGSYNDPIDTAIFMIGNGTTEDVKDANGNIITKNRRNAFEIHSNGDAKISNSIILTDKTTGTNYKVYIDNGKLQLEEVVK
jgi:hypothetical protein